MTIRGFGRFLPSCAQPYEIAQNAERLDPSEIAVAWTIFLRPASTIALTAASARLCEH
jgi:hypothetical protein